MPLPITMIQAMKNIQALVFVLNQRIITVAYCNSIKHRITVIFN